MRYFLIVVLLVGLSSCFLFKDYKRKSFVYTADGQSHTTELLVPKGYSREEVRDTAGIQLHNFQYPGGAMLYAAYVDDTTYQLQTIDTSLHQPKWMGTARVYKGQDRSEKFYREMRQGHLRFGYYGVPIVNEVKFDSATNYAVLKPVRL